MFCNRFGRWVVFAIGTSGRTGGTSLADTQPKYMGLSGADITGQNSSAGDIADMGASRT